MLELYLSICETEEDKQKISYIYEGYYQLMYCAAWDIVKNDDNAADIVHDTMLKLIKNSQTISIDGEFPLKTYVTVAVKHAAIDYLRVVGKKDSMTTEDISSHWDIEDDSTDVINAVIEKDEYERIVQYIRELPDKYKNVCYLRYVSDLNESEIAQVLNISYANVATRLHRGRKMLQKRIEEVRKNEK